MKKFSQINENILNFDHFDLALDYLFDIGCEIKIRNHFVDHQNKISGGYIDDEQLNLIISGGKLGDFQLGESESRFKSIVKIVELVEPIDRSPIMETNWSRGNSSLKFKQYDRKFESEISSFMSRMQKYDPRICRSFSGTTFICLTILSK